MNRMQLMIGVFVLIGASLHDAADGKAGDLPLREPLDTLWEQQMLEGRIEISTAIELRDGRVFKSEIPMKWPIEYARGAPESAYLFGGRGISVMQLGEGFWGNGGWVLEGGLLGRAREVPSSIELFGKAVVRRKPYFPFPFHRDTPQEASYEFFLLQREAEHHKASILKKWTFTPQDVELEPRWWGPPPDPQVRATLEYDGTSKTATVTISGLTHAFKESVRVPSAP